MTARNAEGIFSGIGEEGILESQRSVLNSIDFDATEYDAIYCSSSPRCKETAESLGLASYIEEPRIVERHFGIFDGLTPEQCMEAHPGEFSAFRALDADFQIPGGESRAQHLARVLEWVESVTERSNVLAVTHGGTIDFLVRLGSKKPVHGGIQVFAGSHAALSAFEVFWPEVVLVEHDIPLSPRPAI